MIQQMSAIKTDRQIMGGVPCFAGTRVPVRFLFDWLADDSSVTDFLQQFPTISREQAQAVLAEAGELLGADPEWLVEAERKRLAAKADEKAEFAGVA